MIIFLIGAIQVLFTVLCIREANKKGRLNTWWILAAFIFGVFAYIVINKLPPKIS